MRACCWAAGKALIFGKPLFIMKIHLVVPKIIDSLKVDPQTFPPDIQAPSQLCRTDSKDHYDLLMVHEPSCSWGHLNGGLWLQELPSTEFSCATLGLQQRTLSISHPREPKINDQQPGSQQPPLPPQQSKSPLQFHCPLSSV